MGALEDQLNAPAHAKWEAKIQHRGLLRVTYSVSQNHTGACSAQHLVFQASYPFSRSAALPLTNPYGCPMCCPTSKSACSIEVINLFDSLAHIAVFHKHPQDSTYCYDCFQTIASKRLLPNDYLKTIAVGTSKRLVRKSQTLNRHSIDTQ